MGRTKKPMIEQIRTVVQRECGGFETATDGEIMALWRTFTPARRTRMLDEDAPDAGHAAGRKSAAKTTATPTPAAAEDDGSSKGHEDDDTPEP